jgi:hypothetical protein
VAKDDTQKTIVFKNSVNKAQDNTPSCEWHDRKFLIYFAENKPRCFHLQVVVPVNSSFIDSRQTASADGEKHIQHFCSHKQQQPSELHQLHLCSAKEPRFREKIDKRRRR